MKLNFIPVGSKYVTNQPKWSTVPCTHKFGEKEWRGLVCGKLSDNVEVIDVDIKNDPLRKVVTDYLKAIPRELRQKMVVQSTKSDGIHLIYRCEEINGNIVLAKDESGKPIIETRGEGGYINCVPTKGYVILKGKTFDDIQTITAEERQELMDIAQLLNRALPQHTDEPVAVRKSKGGLSVSAGITNSAAGELAVLREAADILLGNKELLDGMEGRDIWRDRILFPLSQLAKDFPDIHGEVEEIYKEICNAGSGRKKNNIKEWISATKSARDDIGFASFLNYVTPGSRKIKSKDTEIREDMFTIQSIGDIMARPRIPFSYYVDGLINDSPEIVAIFGDTGSGKTTFGYHLANCIAAGTSIFMDMPNGVKEKKVLYMDFELSEDQVKDIFMFTRLKGTKSEVETMNFSVNLSRLSMQWDKYKPGEPIGEGILKNMDKYAEIYDVIFLDNLTMAMREQENSDSAKEVMATIKAITQKTNTKVFLMAHTPKMEFKEQPIRLEDMAGSKNLSNLVDSSIACGKSRTDPTLRYIKQLKHREPTQIEYGDSNIILTTRDGPGIQFVDTDEEWSHVKKPTNVSKEDKEALIIAYLNKGMQRTEISKELSKEGIKLSPRQVGRYKDKFKRDGLLQEDTFE